jgi:serine/threonine-protein kinase
MNLCPTCKTSFSGGEQFCPKDGTPLRPSLPDDPLAGRVLSGRYRLIEVIGRGGMGAVYRAHHILMDKGVAVKVLRQELASDTEAVARFHREARSASRLDHDNIIRVSDFGQTDDGLLFLVMELLEGENLAQVLRRGALPWRRAAAVARDVALGLSHAHEQGVIHRDLKPENIVLCKRGRGRPSPALAVKVLDFGLAKLVHMHGAGGEAAAHGADDAEPDVAVQSLTRSGVVFGTPEYMSPEQAEGRALDPRTDIYALGVVSYQMLTGKLPFSAPTFLALIAKTVNEPPPPLREQEPGISLPSELESLVLRCLAKSPEDRPQSAEEIAEIIIDILGRYPEEAMRSGEREVAASGQGQSQGQGSLSPTSGVAGGVARTVQRHLPPGQTPRTAPKDSPRPAPVIESAPAPSVRAPEAPAQAEADDANDADDAEPAQEAPPPVPTSLAREESAPHGDVPLRVPRRPYWLAAAAIAGASLVGVYLARPYLTRLMPDGFPDEAAAGADASREPLRRARELLSAAPPSQTQVDEALRILRDEREVRGTPEVHRLLARAYELGNNRLRALGHLYTAVRLCEEAAAAAAADAGKRRAARAELSRSLLSLSQLLSRLGHSQEACQTASRLFAEKDAGQGSQSSKNTHKDALPDDVRREAQALAEALRCAPRN